MNLTRNHDWDPHCIRKGKHNTLIHRMAVTTSNGSSSSYHERHHHDHRDDDEDVRRRGYHRHPRRPHHDSSLVACSNSLSLSSTSSHGPGLVHFTRMFSSASVGRSVLLLLLSGILLSAAAVTGLQIPDQQAYVGES